MIQWTSEKDAILLVGIFEYANIKISKELCEALADKIGEGCTAKAVSHRLGNLKKSGNPTAAAGSTPTKTSSTKSTARKTTSGRGKKTKDVGNGNSPMDDEEIQSPSAGRKRGRSGKKDVDEEDEVEIKKMKVENEVTDIDDDFSGIISGEWKDGSTKLEEGEEDECV